MESVGAWASRETKSNPVPSSRTLLNVQLPAISQHTLTFGAGMKVTDDIAFNVAYAHAFRNYSEGQIVQLLGTRVREDVQVDSIVLGVTIQFGGKRKLGASREMAWLPPLPR